MKNRWSHSGIAAELIDLVSGVFNMMTTDTGIPPESLGGLRKNGIEVIPVNMSGPIPDEVI